MSNNKYRFVYLLLVACLLASSALAAPSPARAGEGPNDGPSAGGQTPGDGDGSGGGGGGGGVVEPPGSAPGQPGGKATLDPALPCSQSAFWWEGLPQDDWYLCGKWGWWWKPSPKFDAYLFGDLLVLDGFHFARQHTFRLRARRESSDWKELGIIRVDPDGDVQQAFRLPGRLQDANRLLVCLKDVDNDKNHCTWARREH